MNSGPTCKITHSLWRVGGIIAPVLVTIHISEAMNKVERESHIYYALFMISCILYIFLD